MINTKWNVYGMLLEETDPAHPMNATELCEKMQSRYEYSYNRKTIYTDIERLKTYGMKIRQIIGEEFAFELDIQILRDVDRSLYGRENVVTSDSVILDHCVSWVNLAAECVNRKGKQGICVWNPERNSDDGE